jgi:Leucine-rich repeat (LRR) protein
MSDAIRKIEEVIVVELEERETIDSLWTDAQSPKSGYVVDDHGRIVELQIARTPFEDLTALERCPELRRLALVRSNVSEIEPLQQLINLTQLNFAFNKISDA